MANNFWEKEFREILHFDIEKSSIFDKSKIFFIKKLRITNEKLIIFAKDPDVKSNYRLK